MTEVVVGAGSIGQAIARRVSAGRKLLLAGLKLENMFYSNVIIAGGPAPTRAYIE